MKIEIEIPKEFEGDWESDRFEDFFERALADMNGDGCGGNYEREIAKMFICAFKNGIINNQPQVRQWIPCSERLPTNQTEWWRTTEYLTCGKDGTIQVLCYCDGWNCSFLNADMDVYRDNEIKNIIAWMPLPQPYTENRKES